MQNYKQMYDISNYLLTQVADNGGWGSKPNANNGTNPLNTAEVLCGLIVARSRLYLSGLPQNYDKTIENAIKYLYDTQLTSGGWATRAAYRLGGDRKNAKGNVVSTCFTLWALILHYGLIEKDSRTIDVIRKAIAFLNECSKDGLYCYSPGLTNPELIYNAYIPMAYIFLSYSLILSLDSTFSRDRILTEEEQTKVLKTILKNLDLVDSAIDDDPRNFKQQFFSIILIRFSISLLSKINNIDLVLNKVQKIQKKLEDIISELSSDQLTKPYTENQVIMEEGYIRDFMHYVPVWVYMLYSQLEEQNFVKEVSNVIHANISNGRVVILDGQEWIWATGLTLFALAH